jgi:hypothetical protein
MGGKTLLQHDRREKMGSPYYTWDAAVDAAMKILGKKGKIPDKLNQDNHRVGLLKCFKEYNAAVDALQNKIKAFQDLMSARKNAIKQAKEAISKSNLGLDPKNDDDKTKIKQAQDIMNGFIDGCDEPTDDMIKYLGKLDAPMKSLVEFKST